MKQSWSTLVLAAGKGTRMKSDKAKVLHEIDGKPLLSHVLDTAEMLPLARSIVVVGHQADRVKDAHAAYKLDYALQDPQLGTGHAVMCAREFLEGQEGSLLVLYGDVPLLRPATLHELMERHERSGYGVTVLTARLKDPSGYGRILRDEAGDFSRIVEDRDLSEEQRGIDEINSGIYTFRIESLLEALDGLKNDNAQEEYYLTDTLAMIREKGLGAGIMEISDPEEISGINTIPQLDAAAAVRAERRNVGEGAFGCPVLDRFQKKSDLILFRRDGMIVSLAPHPYNAGHIWITPERPVVFFGSLDSEEQRALFQLGKEAEGWLEEAFRPQGFNIGYESGRTGRQLVLHVIPRWSGDANFMPLIGETNVLPEELEQTRDRLQKIIARP